MLSFAALVKIFTVSQLVLTLAGVLQSHEPVRVRWLAAALIGCVQCYLLDDLVTGVPGAVLEWGAELTAGMLLVLVFCVFDDRPPPAWSWVLLGLLAIHAAWMVALESSLDGMRLGRWLLHGAKLGMVVVVVVLLLRGARDDLVEARLQVRFTLAASIATATLLVLGIELGWRWQVPPFLEVPGMVLIALAVLSWNLAFLRLDPRFRLAPTAAPVTLPERPPSGADDPLADRVLALMDADQPWRDPDLRIQALAARLGATEVRLRRSINRTLGYPNFNQFVNGYRIAEAAARLRAEPAIPVLNVALDAGFRSLSTFNAAFRAQQGCTPTEWRQRWPADFRQS